MRLARIGVAVCIAAVLPSLARAQAWTPPSGAGAVTFGVQMLENTGHRLTDGFIIPDGRSRNASVRVDVDYALTDRVSVSAGVPLVFGRYIGPGAPPFGYLPVDECHCWQHGMQDLGLTARYGVLRGATGVTASTSVQWPTHDYPYQGEAVVGRHLREWAFGVDAGRRLDGVWDRLIVQGNYSYAVVERVLSIPNNRSNAGLEGDVLVTPRTTIRGLVLWQRTHGGLRAGSPPPADFEFPGDINTPERIAEHDRLLRDNYVHVGVGASYEALRFDLFASLLFFATGTDTHTGRALTVGISLPFDRHGF
jgi:hypothetical protein